MNTRYIEIAAKCAVYRDLTNRLFDAHIINQAMFDLLEAQIQRLERQPILGDTGEEPKLSRNITTIEPKAAEAE